PPLVPLPVALLLEPVEVDLPATATALLLTFTGADTTGLLACVDLLEPEVEPPVEVDLPATATALLLTFTGAETTDLRAGAALLELPEVLVEVDLSATATAFALMEMGTAIAWWTLAVMLAAGGLVGALGVCADAIPAP